MVGSGGALADSADEAIPVIAAEADTAPEADSAREVEAVSEPGAEAQTDGDGQTAADEEAEVGEPTGAEEQTDSPTMTGNNAPNIAASPGAFFVSTEGDNYLMIDTNTGIVELSDAYTGGFADLLAGEGPLSQTGNEAASLKSGDGRPARTTNQPTSSPSTTGPVGLEGLPTAAQLLDFSDPDQQEFCGKLSCMIEEQEKIVAGQLPNQNFGSFRNTIRAGDRSGARVGASVGYDDNSEFADRVIEVMSWIKTRLRRPSVIFLLVLGLLASSLLPGRKSGRSGRI